MTLYEIARRAVAPFMPALEGEVAALLAEAVPCGATLLEVGGRKSPYMIGPPVAVEVIEHVVDDEGFVRNLARVVRPGGPVVLATPNGDARPVHGADHRRHYRRDQLIKLVTPYFDVVFVRYAVAMTDNRLVGMRSFSQRRPRGAANLVVCSGPGSRMSSRCRRRVW